MDNTTPFQDEFIGHEEQNELYEHYRIVVDKGQELLRIDKFLQLRLGNISRNKIQMAAKASCILVNGSPVKSNYKVKPLDVVTILLPTPPQNTEILPEYIPLDIVYEDDDVLVIDKQAGLVVHPGYANFNGTLLNGLVYYFQNKLDSKGNPITPYLVHRIDKDTSGLLLIAKNEESQIILSKQFFEHSIKRKYNALVWGDFDDQCGTIVGNLGRSLKDRRIMSVYPYDDSLPDDQQRGKHAVTHWSVIERFGYTTLVECVLETGRTHQIRAHMKHIGHPLFNDSAYGGNEILKGTTFTKYRQFINNCFEIMPRQSLHAVVLGFCHPMTGEHLYFESKLPKEFCDLISKWRGYAQSVNHEF